MSPVERVRYALLAAGAAVALAACTGGPDPSGTASATSEAAEVPASVAWTPVDDPWPADVEGTLYSRYGVAHPGTGPELSGEAAIVDAGDAEVRLRAVQVVAGDDSTLLVWSISSPDGALYENLQLDGFGDLSDAVTYSLAGSVGYVTGNGVTLGEAGVTAAAEPLGTYDGLEWLDADQYDWCLCTDGNTFVTDAPYFHEALYPAIAEDVDEVEVTFPGFGTVTVPVTRS